MSMVMAYPYFRNNRLKALLTQSLNPLFTTKKECSLSVTNPLLSSIKLRASSKPSRVFFLRSRSWVASMRHIERAVENVLAERIAVQERIEWNPLRRFEDFTVNHMQSLAIGAAGAILSLSSMMLFWSPAQTHIQADPMVVGSILSADTISARAKWIAIKKPVQIIALEAPQVSGITPHYSASRTEQGDHQDSLSFDAQSLKRPELRVTLTRGNAHGVAPTLYIDMIRQQSEHGVAVSKAGQTGMVQSKFGALEVADMTFTKSDDSARACLAFRSAVDSSLIGISGWYCAANMAVAERPELSCILDKLILLKGGQDKELRRYFTQAENARTPCVAARSSSGRKATWLDTDGKVPTFRSDITGSIDNGATKKK
jgi:hypothetical protein